MADMQVLEELLTTDGWALLKLTPEEQRLVEQVDALLGIAVLPDMPPDLALSLLDVAWVILEEPGHA